MIKGRLIMQNWRSSARFFLGTCGSRFVFWYNTNRASELPWKNPRRTSPVLHHQSGVTLVEMLIAMALLSIFMLTLTDIFTAALDVQKESQATSTVNEDGRFILERFTYDITHATAIATPATAGASSASLVMTIGGATVTYALSGGILQRTDSVGTDALTSSEITASALDFQRLGASGTIRMNLTLTSATRQAGGQETRTFTTTAGKRL